MAAAGPVDNDDVVDDDVVEASALRDSNEIQSADVGAPTVRRLSPPNPGVS